MKILHVYKTYLPENFMGVPRVIHELSEGLSELGIESEVLALYDNAGSDPLLIGNHRAHQVKRDIQIASTSLSVSIFGKFRHLVKDMDVIHYHFPWPVADLLYFLYGREKPSVITYHSDIVKQRNLLRFYRPIMNQFLSAADAIVATSPNYVETSAVLSCHRKQLSVIPIGIEDRKQPEIDLIEKWRTRVGEGFFLFVGALRYYKGLPFLLKAARDSRLPLVIVGSSDRAAQAIIGDLPKNIKMVGAISDEDKEALLSLCGAFVFPSNLRSEAFGVALLEAARAGKPMISCEIGTGTSFVNEHNVTGLVVPPSNAGALAEAMQILSVDLKTAKIYGKNARKRYEAKFQAKTMCDKYLKLYQEVTS